MKNKKKAIIWIVVVCVAIAITSAIVIYTCYHRWDTATCTTPKICSICGKTEGEPLGHQWIDATCTKPRTCGVCGKTEGEALGHQWSDATCTEPQTCSACGETKGKELEHDSGRWETIKEPTCTATGEKETTCKRCGKSLVEEIPMTEHIPGEWTVTEDYKVNRDGTVAPGTQVLPCSVCNTEIESKEYTIELTISQKNAVIRAYEEENFWHVSRNYLINDVLVGSDYFSVEDATFAVDHMDVDFDEQAVLYVQQNSAGQSKGKITQMMRYYGYTKEQINNALEQAGF